MDLYLKIVVYLMTVIAIALMAGSVASGALNSETAYLTSVGLFVLSGVVFVAAHLHQRIAALEQRLSDHKSHDRAALVEAARLSGETPPAGVRQMHR